MPTIGAAVPAAVKDHFEAIAKSRHTTASRLAAKLIVDFLADKTGGEVVLSPLTLPSEEKPLTASVAKTEQVFVRLDPYYFTELGRLAGERNWYRSTYLANLFQAHADRRPVMCDAEINAVRQVARQLADVGRNINQIARKLNASVEHAHLVTTMDFELIKMLIDLESSLVRDLMRANLRGWGVCDA